MSGYYKIEQDFNGKPKVTKLNVVKDIWPIIVGNGESRNVEVVGDIFTTYNLLVKEN